MAAAFKNKTAAPPVDPAGATPRSQFYSWLRGLLRWIDKARERQALRDLVDNKHLLDDIGLSREKALREVDTPFWR